MIDQKALLQNVQHFYMDISDPELMEKALLPDDIVIHLAAQSHVDVSFKNPVQTTVSNVVGVHSLLASCVKKGVKKIVIMSTDEVYGSLNQKQRPFSEDSQYRPNNPYSASKAAAEIIINSYKYHLKSNILIVRGNNIFGNRQYPEKLIPSCIYNVLKNKPIKLHGNGKNIRCYLSVYDFADAIYLLIKKNC